MDYSKFIESKKRAVINSGFDCEPSNGYLFDFQRAIVKWALKKGKSALFLDTGLGKGQPYGSKVMTFNGWKNIEDLIIGDMIISSDGKPYPVTGIYPKQDIETYRFHYSDGISQVFDKDHIHICRTNNDRARNKPWRNMTTTELLNCGNLRPKSGKEKDGTVIYRRNYDIPIVKPIEYAENKFLISPYIIGALIGDGCLRNNSTYFSSNDIDIVQRITDELPIGVTISKKDEINYCICGGLNGNQYNIFNSELIRLGLKDCLSNNKFLPKEYLFSSVEQRLNLLRGLMDTDGYIKESCQFYTVSEMLKNDVKQLIQSLGGIPTESIKRTTYKYNGEIKQGQLCYILTFSLKTFNPFYIKRKSILWNPNPRDNGRWIDRIEFESIQKTVCISVDSPDNSYVTENHIVTHNTLCQLSWSYEVSKYTGGKILIIAPLAVSKQTKREGEKFGIDVNICRKQDDVVDGINITNYEMLEHFVPSEFVGVVLDESSIIKSFTGKTTILLIEMFKHTLYKLACTATPSPNDYTEIGTHAEFLNIMSRTEMLATYFINDMKDTSKWRLKGHAETEFFKWLATWGILISNPKDIGFEENGYDLPQLNINHIIIESEIDECALTIEVAQTLTERRQARKESLFARADKAKQIVENLDNCLIWCDFNNESEHLKNIIPQAIEVKGSDKSEHKENSAIEFANGNIKYLISKPSIFGYGLNFQKCHNMIFVGLSDSYEQFYQAIRRCWRFGQTKEVNIYVIISEKEMATLQNIQRKESDHKELKTKMIALISDILKCELKNTTRNVKEYTPEVTIIIPKWVKKEIK